jgi:hypothetical protein
MRENSDFETSINEIYVELSGNSQRYVNECCESESDGKIDGFAAGCCKRRGGGVAVAVWYCDCESIEMHYKNEKRLYKIDEGVIGLWNNQHQHFEDVNSKMDNLLQKMDAAWTKNINTTHIIPHL